MDLRSLQHHGDNALALARAFGAADLDSFGAAGDATYFPVPGGLVRYPGWLSLAAGRAGVRRGARAGLSSPGAAAS